MNKRNLLELRDSLRRRGFWVDIVEAEFVLDSWYSRSNFNELVRLLNQFPLSLEIGEKGIRINSDSLPSGLLKQIETASREDVKYSIKGNLIPSSWNYNERNDLAILELDYGIAALVFALNKVGFQTSMSCDGHGRKEANMWFNHLEYMKEISNLLFSASKENSFAYDWEIRKENVGFALATRKRLANEAWDVSKIQDDVFSLSNLILKEISLNNRKIEIGS
ncbi:hypothetical protein R4Z09_12125 [Niallia oryzisoli]|uniref:Uncharacterized protein n=1 Tax=Niallia oryzisoli TaxID=1737571 RepID=A0ABZ2CRF0_9BACI